MAKVRHMHSHTTNLRGRVGDLIYKWYGKRLVITRAPRKSTKKPTAKKLASCREFSAASRYAERARQDPELWALYVAAAKQQRIPARAYAISDYRSVPKIGVVVVTTGEKGGFVIRTADKFSDKTVAVKVTVSDWNGRPVSAGAAKRRSRQVWRYDLPIRDEAPLKLEVTLVDRFNRKTVADYEVRESKSGALDMFRV